jgi:hypothetical protein
MCVKSAIKYRVFAVYGASVILQLVEKALRAIVGGLLF